MKSLHINSDNNQLYTVIHSPSENNKSIRNHGVVICPPITHEHAASYWAVRQLANRLTKFGFDVARFDYFATGNSSGLSQQVSLQTCTQNIEDVGRFLLKQANCKKLSYVGLRLGAALATMSALKHSPDHLVLWDPVINGEEFISQLEAMHEKYLKKMDRTDAPQHNLGQEYLGFPYPEPLLRELNKLHLGEIELPNQIPLSILTSVNNEEQNQFIKHVGSTRPNLQHEIAKEGSIDWQDISILESSFLPGQSINQICDFLKTSL